jgi:AraC-like DNA-binding protein
MKVISRHIILFLLLLLSGQDFYAQDTIKMKQLRDSFSINLNKNVDRSLNFGKKLESLLETDKKYLDELIELKIILSGQYIYQNKLDEATSKVQEAIILSDLKHNDSLKAVAYKTLGNVYYQEEDYIPAIKYYALSDSLANNELHSIKIRYNYSGIKQSIGSYEDALDIKLEVFNKLKDDNRKEIININIKNVLNIINVYKMLLRENPHKKEEYLSEIKKFTRIYNDFHSKNEFDNIIFDLTHLSILLDSSSDKRIIKKFDSLQSVLWKNNAHYIDEMIFFEKAKYYYQNNDYLKALGLLKKIDSIGSNGYKKIKYKDEMEMLYSKVYSALGEKDLALQKMTSANAILKKKKRQREEVSRVLDQYYDYNTISKKIKALDAKNKETVETSVSVWWFIVLLFLSMILLFIVYKRQLNNNVPIETNASSVVDNDSENREESDEVLIMDQAKKLEQATDEVEEAEEMEEVEEVEEAEEKYSGKIIIPPEILDKRLLNLKQYGQTKLYLSPNTSLKSLAEFLGLNRVYTSKLLNDYLNTTYKDYINKLRMDYVIDRIKNDDDFRKLSVERIAKQSGYNSLNTFSRIFKQATGFTPYQYIMHLKKNTK